MRKTITLKGLDIYSQVVVAKGVDQGTPNKRGDAYYIMAFNGIAFTLDQETFDQYNAGQLAHLTLIQSQREVPDVNPETGEETGTSRMVEAINYAGKLTYTQAKNIAGNEVSIIGSQLVAARDLGINAADLATMLGVTSAKVTAPVEVSARELETA